MPGRKFRPNVSCGRNTGLLSPTPTTIRPSVSNVPTTPTIYRIPLSNETATPLSDTSPFTYEIGDETTGTETTPTCTINSIPTDCSLADTDNESPVVMTNTGSNNESNNELPPNGSGNNPRPIHNDVVVQSGPSKTTWTRKKIAPKLPSSVRPRKRKEAPVTESDDQSKRPKTDDPVDNGHPIADSNTIGNSVTSDSTLADVTPSEEIPSTQSVPEDNMTDNDTSMAPPIEEPLPYPTDSSLLIASTVEVSVTTPTIAPDDNWQPSVDPDVNNIHDADCTTTPTVDEHSNTPLNDIHEQCDDVNDIHDSTTNDSRSTRSVSETSSSVCSVDDGTNQRKRKTRKRRSSPSKRSKKSSSTESRKSKSSQFKDAPDRAKMTMQELIYYNPSANPMSDKGKGTKNTQEDTSKSVETTSHDGSRSTSPNKTVDDDNEGRLVPQLKIGMNGCIEIDEQSMIVESSHVDQIDYQDIVHEEGDYTTSTSFRTKRKIKKWTKDETNEFYTALSKVGTDFTMMTLLLPKRTRTELKNKFKKEEKSNSGRISNAMDRLCSIKRTTPTTPATPTLAS